MKGIIKFCDKTINETVTLSNSIERILKQNMGKKEVKKIEETISWNEERTRRVFKQRKFKKFKKV